MPETGPRFREYSIHPALTPHVKCIWSLEGPASRAEGPRERILPDGCVELVMHFADPFRSYFANGGNAVQPRSFLVGQMKRFLEIEPFAEIGFVAVRFHARGAYRFLAAPLRAIADEVVDLREVWPGGMELSEEIASARAMPERLCLVERTLLAGQVRKNDGAVDRALHLIEMTSGQMRVRELAEEIGVSERDLSRRFEKAVGLSPKEFARGQRFRSAVTRLQERDGQSLTEIALDCGYYDQAHFNHDFFEQSGMTPGEFASFPSIAI